MKRHSVLKAAAVYYVVGAAFFAVVHAQTPPDAGALRQQLEQNQTPPLPRQATPAPVPLPAVLKGRPGSEVSVSQVRFIGNTLLSQAQLAPLVQPYLHRPQTFGQLQEAAAAVANAYRDAGWLARAYLPKQDITDGVLTIAVVEAVFSGATREGAEPLRIDPSQVLNIFNTQQPVGQAVNNDALDRALLLANDLPGVVVVSTMRQGQKEGETGINLKISKRPLAMGELGLENTGSLSTGAERLTASVYLGSAMGLGDLLAVNWSKTKGSDYVRASLTVPVGSNGWRVGGSASGLNYHVVAPESSVALQAKGQSDSLGLEARYPLVRTRNRNLYLNLGADQKTYLNEDMNGVQSDYANSNVNAGISGNAFDGWGKGGSTSGSLTMLFGNLALGAEQTGERNKNGGAFRKLRYSLSRQQTVSEAWTWVGTLTGQQAEATLDSSEAMILGGSSGVRAYPSGEGSGSRGYVATLELRWRLSPTVNVTGFYDQGSVGNDDGTPSYSLAGAGLGATWATPAGATFKAVWAQRIGSNPNPSATGTDQDGTLVPDRWWLSLSLPF